MVLSSCQPSTPTPKEGCMCFQRDVCLIWPQNLVYRKRVVFLVCIPGDSDGEESACSARELGSVPGLGRSPWRRAWPPTTVFLPGEPLQTEKPGGLQSMGLQRVQALVGYTHSSVQSHSRVRLFATPWIATHQASLSITNSWSSPKPVSIELVMPSNHLILCCPLLLNLY